MKVDETWLKAFSIIEQRRMMIDKENCIISVWQVSNAQTVLDDKWMEVMMKCAIKNVRFGLKLVEKSTWQNKNLKLKENFSHKLLTGFFLEMNFQAYDF
jgi:hypothetical protein